MMRRNPFRFSRPAAVANFVGRWPDVQRVAADLTIDDGDSFGLIGGRRCGKSSFLLALAHQLQEEEFAADGDWRALPLAIDCAGLTVESAGGFLAMLLERLRRVVDLGVAHGDFWPWPAPVRLDAGWFADLAASPTLSLRQFEDGVGYSLEALVSDLPVRLVLLVDEVDKLVGQPWTVALFDQLRALVYSGRQSDRVRLVLAGSRRFIDEANSTGSPLNNILTRHFLTVFGRDGFDELTDRDAALAADHAEQVWQASGGHPWIAQYLLHQLWNARLSTPPASVVDQGVAAAMRTMQTEMMQMLEGWAEAMALEGLRAYDVLRANADWVDESTILAAVDDPTLNVKRGLVALCYHGVVVHDGSWARYRRAGDLWAEWFAQNRGRLLAVDAAQNSAGTPISNQPAIHIEVKPTFENRNVNASGERAVAVGGDADGALVVTGDENQVGKREEGRGQDGVGIVNGEL